jgi:hypothetical protein
VYFLLLLSQRLSPLCSNRQTASRLTIIICNSIKHLWALPKPATFEKVDQTFIFGTENFSFALLYCPTDNLLNHNFQPSSHTTKNPDGKFRRDKNFGN